MTTLIIGRAGLHRPDLTITGDGTGRFDLHGPGAWRPGAKQRQNAYAGSRWRGGGLITSSTEQIAPANLIIRVQGASPEDAADGVRELDEALAQWDYPITEAVGARRIAYRCCPWTAFDEGRDEALLELGIIVVTAVVPRQP